MRARLRRQFDFYISDFASGAEGFVASDVDDPVARAVITVTEDDEFTDSARRVSNVDSGPRSVKPTSVKRQAAGIDAAPRDFTRASLEGSGFAGWGTWNELRASDLAGVPSVAGTYVVYRPSSNAASFLRVSPAGHFKDQDPTVELPTLTENWVGGAHVVYIGKADRLRTRLRQYARFGAGQPIGHWGGRCIWQLADSDELLVAWRPVSGNETAREAERLLLVRFAALHSGRRPFANLTG